MKKVKEILINLHVKSVQSYFSTCFFYQTPRNFAKLCKKFRFSLVFCIFILTFNYLQLPIIVQYSLLYFLQHHILPFISTFHHYFLFFYYYYYILIYINMLYITFYINFLLLLLYIIVYVFYIYYIVYIYIMYVLCMYIYTNRFY